MLARRWRDLHDEAAQLAAIAGLGEDPVAGEVRAFADALCEASEWQRELAWQGIEDIDAMMRPGLAALRTLESRGQDASAPALTLWREFHAARDTIRGIIERAPDECRADGIANFAGS